MNFRKKIRKLSKKKQKRYIFYFFFNFLPTCLIFLFGWRHKQFRHHCGHQCFNQTGSNWFSKTCLFNKTCLFSKTENPCLKIFFIFNGKLLIMELLIMGLLIMALLIIGLLIMGFLIKGLFKMVRLIVELFIMGLLIIFVFFPSFSLSYMDLF